MTGSAKPFWFRRRCLSDRHGATDGGPHMSRLTIGIFGAIALSLSVGAAQFALGHDLSEATLDGLQNSLTEPLTGGINAVSAGGDAVNRGSKTDRAARFIGSSAQTRTIALRLEGFSDTSFLVRVPAANGAGNSSSAPPATKSKNRKMTVASEPVVSVLTEVAKLLE